VRWPEGRIGGTAFTNAPAEWNDWGGVAFNKLRQPNWTLGGGMAFYNE
jgi:hypothetical protein